MLLQISKNTLKFILKIFSRFIPINHNLLVYFDNNYTGSNLYFLDKTFLAKKINVDSIKKLSNNNTDEEKTQIFRHKIKHIQNFIKNYYYLNRAKTILITSGLMSYKLKKKQIVINLWHGVGPKSFKEINGVVNVKTRYKEYYDFIISPSRTSCLILEHFFQSNIGKFLITGYPRNDLLLKPLCNVNDFRDYISNKEINYLYAPTWRSCKTKDCFPFTSENLREFDDFLDEKKINFIWKEHKNSNSQRFKGQYKNIKFLNDRYFQEKKIDFYNFVGFCDVLVTDFSSIYVDFLLTNKPIIFFVYDFDDYNFEPGIMFENINRWFPGEITYNLKDLKKAINRQINKDEFNNYRDVLKNDLHRYKDNRSTIRFINELNKILKEK